MMYLYKTKIKKMQNSNNTILLNPYKEYLILWFKYALIELLIFEFIFYIIFNIIKYMVAINVQPWSIMILIILISLCRSQKLIINNNYLIVFGVYFENYNKKYKFNGYTVKHYINYNDIINWKYDYFRNKYSLYIYYNSILFIFPLFGNEDNINNLISEIRNWLPDNKEIVL